MELSPDWREFLRLFNSHGVEYIVVGAIAAGCYARPRFTGDLDVLVRPSTENSRRVEAALRDFGFGSTGLTAGDFVKRDAVVQLGFRPGRIDVLTSISGVSFEEAWQGKTQVAMAGLPVWILGKAELVRNKRAAGRPQDLADLENLEE